MSFTNGIADRFAPRRPGTEREHAEHAAGQCDLSA